MPCGFDLILDGKDGTDCPAPSWPKDFPERLERLEDLSGISPEEFACVLALPEERAREWRSSAMPTTGEVWVMALRASQVPGASDVLLAPYFRPRPGRE